MAISDFFSPVAFFICLREVLEAGIIIAVLLGFINQLHPPTSQVHGSSSELLADPDALGDGYGTPNDSSARRMSTLGGRGEAGKQVGDREKMVKAMRLQIWTGAVGGGAVAAIIGAVFLVAFHYYTHDLWQDAENLWEGGFCLLACLLILIMGLAFLKLPHAQTKWRLKLLSAYKDQSAQESLSDISTTSDEDEDDEDGRANLSRQSRRMERRRLKRKAKKQGGKMILFGLPFITVLREGLEGVVFLGGIGLSEPPPAIAGGALVGLIIGSIIAYTLFTSTTPLPLRTFTNISTLLLFLIGAGLASRAAFSLERQYFINGVGVAAAEAGTGPGSYRIAGNIWHLTYGDPEPGSDIGSGWAQLAQSVVGWNNIGTVWTVGAYISYWWIIILTLVLTKWKEGRTELFGTKSKRGWQRELSKRRSEGRSELLGHGQDELENEALLS